MMFFALKQGIHRLIFSTRELLSSLEEFLDSVGCVDLVDESEEES